jgi:hypothetical protein
MLSPLLDPLREWRDSKTISETLFQKAARENAVRPFGLG